MATRKIEKQKATISYETLLNGETITTSSASKTLYSGRKLTDYNLFVATVVRGGIRCSMAFTYASFNTNASWISLTEVDSINTQRWYELHRTSDTTVTIQKSSNASDTCLMYLYGIVLA